MATRLHYPSKTIAGRFKMVSPRGGWVDLDIDRDPNPANHDWQWNSGSQAKARINEKDKVWYGEMCIPMDRIDKQNLQVRRPFWRKIPIVPVPGSRGGCGK